MLIFWEQRLVILSVPKTGTTSLEAVLAPHAAIVAMRPPPIKHTTARRYRRHLQGFLERGVEHSFTVVAMMREPISWLGSWYRYRQREEAAETVRSTKGLTFDDFLRGYLNDPAPAFAAVGAQSEFLHGGRKPGPDRIFIYEDMPRFLSFLQDRLQMEIDLPRLNTSPELPLEPDPALVEAVRRKYPQDFALYESLRQGG